MRTHASLVRIARIACGVAIILLGVFWAILLSKIAAGLISGGVDGARGNLHRTILAIGLWRPIDHDPLVGISQGYETLLLCLLLTWALREAYRRLSNADAQE